MFSDRGPFYQVFSFAIVILFTYRIKEQKMTADLSGKDLDKFWINEKDFQCLVKLCMFFDRQNKCSMQSLLTDLGLYKLSWGFLLSSTNGVFAQIRG